MRPDVEELLKQKVLILDGAMGTMLQEQGMMPGQCPELFGIENFRMLSDIHGQYIEAGADIIQTNTFGGNRFKLGEYGLENRVEEINAEAVRIARQSAGDKVLVAASIGPSGRLLPPMGDVDFDQLYAAFSEQVKACEKAGADLISIETMTDIGEARIALIAARENTRLPVIVHMTFENNGRTMMGTDPITALLTLEALQPLAVGANCSGGARELLPVIETMGYNSRVYLSVEPNAGLPFLLEDETVFPDTPEEMAEYALRLRDAGAGIIGGCCGTTPEHIRAIANVLRGVPALKKTGKKIFAFTSRSRCVNIREEALAYIGERINPTARKKLAQDIKEGQMLMVVDEARNQVAVGAPILDVNMGVPGIDEVAAMKQAVLSVQAAVDVPISIDSTNPSVLEEALKNYVGRPLINSTTGEEQQLDIILPLAKKYGAAVLGLCLDEKGIPKTAAGRIEIARKIYKKAREYGLRDEDIYIDCLVQTASAEQSQVMETIKALQQVRDELGVGTVLGVSNVSHGLPAREILNSTYLAMALAAGLDLPIINPFDDRMRDTIMAAGVLLNRDKNCSAFIKQYKDYSGGSATGGGKLRHDICNNCNIPDLLTSSAKTINIEESPVNSEDSNISINKQLKNAVLEGKQEGIEELLEKALHEYHLKPLEIVNQGLIPGIEEAGELYDRKEYFLPQLMMAAETMKKAFTIVKPLLSQQASQNKGTIIMATVEGDIHDIGKNIVCVLLENYGYRVIDLGKDVEAEVILDAAKNEDADIIGLSALMTTTMPAMKEVIIGAKARGLQCKIMVGGAVLTPEYAQSIGADAYSEDARAAVLAAQKLLN
jgi:5-methyltetrahydrofolate--homocysteine methyltransferase